MMTSKVCIEIESISSFLQGSEVVVYASQNSPIEILTCMMQLICSIVFSKLIYTGLFGLFVVHLFKTDIRTNLKSFEHENKFLRPIGLVKYRCDHISILLCNVSNDQ